MKNSTEPIGPKTTGNRWADDRIGRALNRTETQVMDTAIRVLAKLDKGTFPPKLVWERVACDNAIGIFTGKGVKL
jgi:hypothetical protein